MRPAAAMTLCTGSRPFRPRVPVPLFLSLQLRSPFLWLVRITERRVLLWPSLPLVRPQPCWAGRSRWARTTTERSRQAGSENLPFYKRSVFVSGGFLSLSLTASAQDEPSQIFKLDLFGACGDCPISGRRFRVCDGRSGTVLKACHFEVCFAGVFVDVFRRITFLEFLALLFAKCQVFTLLA